MLAAAGPVSSSLASRCSRAGYRACCAVLHPSRRQGLSKIPSACDLKRSVACALSFWAMCRYMLSYRRRLEPRKYVLWIACVAYTKLSPALQVDDAVNHAEAIYLACSTGRTRSWPSQIYGARTVQLLMRTRGEAVLMHHWLEGCFVQQVVLACPNNSAAT